MLWLNPMPIDEDLSIAYENYYTHRDVISNSKTWFIKLKDAYQADRFNYLSEAQNIWLRWPVRFLSQFVFFRESFDYPLVFLKDQSRGRLLELGVGSGESLERFRNWGWDVEGIDFDPKAAHLCQSKGLNVQVGNLKSQQYPQQSFNAIFSSHVLEHISDPVDLMKQCVEILKPNGIFVAITPNNQSVLHRFFGEDWRGLEPPRHLQLFSKAALISAANQAGFSQVTVISSNYSAAGVFSASATLKMGGINSLILRIVSNCVRLYLTAYRRFYPDSGEELILIARK